MARNRRTEPVRPNHQNDQRSASGFGAGAAWCRGRADGSGVGGRGSRREDVGREPVRGRRGGGSLGGRAHPWGERRAGGGRGWGVGQCRLGATERRDGPGGRGGLTVLGRRRRG